MDVLDTKYENFVNSYTALANSIETQKKFHDLSVENPLLGDSLSAAVIKHFELAYETGWKFLRDLLIHDHGLEENSPKAVFRSCVSRGIFSAEISKELIELADVRNLTTHTYNQKTAQEVGNDILKHYAALGKILDIKFAQK